MQTSRAGADRPLEGAASTSRAVRPGRRASRGTFAANCLLARRLAERGVRFIQLYHRGWDQHGNLPEQIRRRSAATPISRRAALIKDLKQRGLLDDTLVIWGGEFGRTVYCQGTLTHDDYGRDHHPRCFTMWMAGGGIKPGMTLRRDRRLRLQRRPTNPVHVHDLHATILHCLGIDHKRLTLQVPGPALPADRRARQSYQTNPDLINRNFLSCRRGLCQMVQRIRKAVIAALAIATGMLLWFWHTGNSAVPNAADGRD